MIAKRVTKDLNKGFAGTVAKASESVGERTQGERGTEHGKKASESAWRRLRGLSGAYEGSDRQRAQDGLRTPAGERKGQGAEQDGHQREGLDL